MKLMAAHVNPKNGEAAPLVAEDIAEIVAQVRARHAALCLVSARSAACCAAPACCTAARCAALVRSVLSPVPRKGASLFCMRTCGVQWRCPDGQVLCGIEKKRLAPG